MANIQRMTSARLGEILTHSGLVTPEQLEEVMASQKKEDKPLGELLVERGFVTEQDVAQALTTQFGLPYLSPKQHYSTAAVTKLIPLDIMRKHRLVPLDKMGDVLTVCICGPVELEVLEDIEKKASVSIQVFVGTITDVKQAIEKLAAESA